MIFREIAIHAPQVRKTCTILRMQEPVLFGAQAKVTTTLATDVQPFSRNDNRSRTKGLARANHIAGQAVFHQLYEIGKTISLKYNRSLLRDNGVDAVATGRFEYRTGVANTATRGPTPKYRALSKRTSDPPASRGEIVDGVTTRRTRMSHFKLWCPIHICLSSSPAEGRGLSTGHCSYATSGMLPD